MAAKGNTLLTLIVLILEFVWIGSIIVGIKRILDGKILMGILTFIPGINYVFAIIDVVMFIISGTLTFGTHF